jgi:hypothetical protein
MKIIEIQRSCEHGGLRPLERHYRLVSQRTGLFYNIKEGGYWANLALEEKVGRRGSKGTGAQTR